MPVPFNPPNQVLFALLGWLDSAAKGVVTTSEEKIQDINSQAPVGTTQALIEQGSAVYSAIHSRLHDSQKRVLKILARLNRWYLDEQRKGEVVADLEIQKDDFKTNSDIIPVSDPHIFAETQRYAQVQALAARAQLNPDLYNRLAVEKRIMKQIRIPDINEVLPDPEEVKDMNSALENVSMTLGKPVGAFIGQNHLAHILDHIQYAVDPIFGGNPIISPTLLPPVIEHIKQHLVLWYLNQTDTIASVSTGKPFNAAKVQPVHYQAQEMLQVVGQHVHQDAQRLYGQKVMPAIQQMLQTLQKMSQNNTQPTYPNIMAQVKALQETTMAETQRKAAYDKADLQLKAKKQADDALAKQQSIVAQEQIESAKITHDVNSMTLEKQFENQQAEQQHQQDIQQQNIQHLQDMQRQQQAAQNNMIAQQGAAQQQQQEQQQQPPQGEGNV
jgi:hypothetical protein